MKPMEYLKKVHQLLLLLVFTTTFNSFYFFIDAPGVRGAAPPDNPVEVGDVNWSRDLEGALLASRQSGKPVFLFFQEVPGCIGCQDFGQQVLTHPLLVEAIEDEFIPVLVYNNRLTGIDAALLKRFGEPSWNYQVIRFIDADQKDLIPRRDRIWDIGGVAGRMIAALKAADRPIPNYLRALAVEHDEVNLRMAVFTMYCFWTGEYQLGSIDGVVATEAGFYRGREATLVTYHRQVLNIETLVEEASTRECAQSVYIDRGGASSMGRLKVDHFDPGDYRRAPPADQKKQLQRWLAEHDHLRLTPLQLTKLNAMMVDNPETLSTWLSPRQLAQLEDGP